MRIACVTTCKGRLQHLKETLPKNIADNAYEDCVFIVLDYGGCEELQGYISKNHQSDLDSGRLVMYCHPNSGPFHMAHAKNMAMRCGMMEGADILITVDADNFTGKDFAQFICDAFDEPIDFLCPDYQLIKSLPHGALRPARGYAGRLALSAQAFLKVGGYDEIYDTWYGEDTDMNFRLQRAGYQMGFITNHFLQAINHNAEVRFKEYPHARRFENSKELDLIKSRTETIVNYGNIGVGTVYRNLDPTPIEIDPVPTRIFGVGFQKTATTSLHRALQELGFDSLHWGAGEAPLIWYEMNALGSSPTLEHHYAISDNPIPLLYKKLDQVYPGSKFILTIRNEVDWLTSVSRLWDHRFNPTRHLWDIYPISNVLHTALYGRKDFDAIAFLQAYRKHNLEVLEYFKDRQDLLIMDMDKGHGWKELCAFLNCPIPDVPYPRKNGTLPLDCSSS